MSLTYATVPLQVEDINLEVSTVHQLTSNPPILFLHGFGSCKEDLADVHMHPTLKEHGYIAYDAPGCGQTKSDKLSATDIPFLVATAEAFLEHFKITRFHLMGHSMGGLTALYLAHRNPEKVLSFVNIKGNLAPEDCFLSRQIFTFKSDDPQDFFNAFIDRTRTGGAYGNALYASTLRARVHVEAVRPIFESMVRLSDDEDLMGMFLGLPFPRMFMFGWEMRGALIPGTSGARGCGIGADRRVWAFPHVFKPGRHV
ncbi:alpha/beta-hydrolase [Penicillium argentinense]|uniref:Alpha/beta-hydrolase n=1 Tax=Penicillium argentinense TaxID=1131581 RepID=A0A9W9K9N0_9EURO|nr:alpha/beta-hydrolase [Penicillium argentinense]KAJ5098128.1 alpha/beta-hydrolase [Penicillium argentinense]